MNVFVRDKLPLDVLHLYTDAIFGTQDVFCYLESVREKIFLYFLDNLNAFTGFTAARD